LIAIYLSIFRPIKVDLPISAAGAFCYYIEYDGTDKRTTGRKGYFNVDPIITLPARSPFFIASDETSGSTPPGMDSKPNALLHDVTSGKVVQGSQSQVHLPLDALAMLSIIAKWQGPINEWDSHYAEASRRGYNFIHYTPLQSRGESGSPYSIYDQLVFDHALLKDGKDTDKDGGEKQVRKALQMAREKYALGSCTDVVLNHTANNSPWLHEHPEAGYSPANSPHLAPAVELDAAMIELSGKLAEKGLPTSVNSESDLNRLASAIRETIDSLNLWQYFVLDVAAEKGRIGSATAKPWKGEDVSGKSDEALAEIAKKSGAVTGYRSLAGRFATKGDAAVAAGLVKAARPNEDPAAVWGKIADIINVDLYQECSADLKAAQEGIVGRLKYTRLEPHGPRLGEISIR
jgi:glycogen debranching enzyme